MPVVQGTWSFVIELRKFYNIDLYHRGYYQIRAFLKTVQSPGSNNTNSGKSISFVAPPTIYKRPSNYRRKSNVVIDCYVDGEASQSSDSYDKACSKTLLIIYRDESVKVCDIFEQRIFMQVDPINVGEALEKVSIFLCVELWFAEYDSDINFNKNLLAKVSEREFQVHITPERILYHHFAAFFDYYHLCGIEMIVYGSLTNISSCVIDWTLLFGNNLPASQNGNNNTNMLNNSNSHINNTRNLNPICNLAQQTWHSILSNIKYTINRRNYALAIHHHLCQTLLAVHQSMLLFWQESLPYLGSTSKPHIEILAYESKLESLIAAMHSLKTNDDEYDDDLANHISLDISRLSSQNTVLFKQLCNSVVNHSKLANLLRQKSHQLRMKRFAEAFFCQELPSVKLLDVYDSSLCGYELLAAEVRQSPYFQKLPALPLSSAELDGDPSTLPIIFEDVFVSPSTDRVNPLLYFHDDSINTTTTAESATGNSAFCEDKNSCESRPSLSSNLSTTSGLNDAKLNLKSVLQQNSDDLNFHRHEPNHHHPVGQSHWYGSKSQSLSTPNLFQPHLTFNRTAKRRFNVPPLSSKKASFVNRLGDAIYRTPIRYSKANIQLVGVRPNNNDDDDGKDVAQSKRQPIVRRPKWTPADGDKQCSVHSTFKRSKVVLIKDKRSRSLHNLVSPNKTSFSTVDHSKLDNSSLKATTCTNCLSVPNLFATCKPSHSVASSCLKPHSWVLPSFPNAAIRTSVTSLYGSIGLGTSNRTPFASPGGCVQLDSNSDMLTFNPYYNYYYYHHHHHQQQQQHDDITGKVQMRVQHAISEMNLNQFESPLESVSKHRKLHLGLKKKKKLLTLAGLAYFGSMSDLTLTSLIDSQPNGGGSRRLSSSISTSSIYHRPLNATVKSELLDLHLKKKHSLCDDKPNCQPNRIHSVQSIPNIYLSSLPERQSGITPSNPTASMQLPMRNDSADGNGPCSSTIDDDDVDPNVTSNEPSCLNHQSNSKRNRLMECGYAFPNGLSQSNSTDSSQDSSIGLSNKGILKDACQMSVMELLMDEQNCIGKEQNPSSLYTRQSTNSVLNQNGSQSLFSSSLSASSLHSYSICHRSLPLYVISPAVKEFLKLKEKIKRQIALDFSGNIYSDFPTVAAQHAYFSNVPVIHEDVHLVVCVHGLDGNSTDLRLVRIYLQFALPDCRLKFLMSEANHYDTFCGFDIMSERLAEEIFYHIEEMSTKPSHLSFIGHSMGCLLIRAVLNHPLMEPYLPLLHTFLSLSGPHLGTVYNSSGLINLGMWVMQKLKKSLTLSQLRLRDQGSGDLRNSYLYHLSVDSKLDKFRHVLLVGSPQDRYVPYNSSRIEMCRAALKDSSTLGVVYMEMVTNLLQNLIQSSRTMVVRYDVHYSLANSTNTLIGRAAHIAVLDSEIFLEKFICVSVAKYFR